jgi:hypothetical protein
MDVSLRSIPIEETRFFKDLYGTFNTQGEQMEDAPSLSVNGSNMPKGYYNLLVCTQQVDGYVRLGMKPTSSWKLKDVKEYFGIKGKGVEISKYLKDLKEFVMNQ